MMEWLEKKVPFVGSVLFRGTLPPRMENFDFLKEKGLTLHKVPDREGYRWTLALEHPDWGKALLECPINNLAPDPILVKHLTNVLTPKERDEVSAAGIELMVKMHGRRNHVIRDRKCALRFLYAIMGEDGLAAVDYLAQTIWSRPALEDELAHDADLDISQIMALHAISDGEKDRKIIWLHSHGLSEVGFFDFDILNPSDDLLSRGRDTLRAIALAILEKDVTPSTPCFVVGRPNGKIRFVEASAFDRYADPGLVELRDGGQSDNPGKRAVICEPAGLLFGRWSRRMKPARILSGPMPDEVLINFSTEASRAMGMRALQTYSTLKKLAAEFQEFGFPVLVKLGYRVDGGGANDLEHLWFTVNHLMDDQIEATLESAPFHIARFKPGDRGVHPISVLTDWLIVTPLGHIDPRNSFRARLFRENKDKFREMLRKFPKIERPERPSPDFEPVAEPRPSKRLLVKGIFSLLLGLVLLGIGGAIFVHQYQRNSKTLWIGLAVGLFFIVKRFFTRR